MLGKDISQALGDISDEMIEASAGAYHKQKHRKTIWFRVAAAAASLAIILTAAFWPRNTEDGFVTAPGILKVYAYDLDAGTEIKNVVSDVLAEGVDAKPSIWSPYLSSTFGLPFSFEIMDDYYTDMEVTFDISVNCGAFWSYKNAGKYEKLEDPITVGNGEKLYWRGARPNEVKDTIQNEGGIYVDIIVRADGVIVGYAIVEIGYAEEPTVLMFPARCETVCFPMIEGELQQVSAEYVAQQLAELKTIASQYSGEEKLAEYHAYIKQIYGADK